MMRALYSGVAGLKTHQTRMDVIGNNIANVNTVGFKSSSANFSDTFYQTVSGASGSNAELGTAGTNAKQIGLGSMVAAIQVNITEQGGPSTTNRALDVAINGESFIVVQSGGTDTLFTKSGAMNVDEAGYLYCTTNGATIMGWEADDEGEIIKDMAKPLQVMGPEKMFYQPEATKAVVMTGNVDPNDPDIVATPDASNTYPVDGGEVMTFAFYDKIGDLYTVKLRITKSLTQANAANGIVEYDVRVEDVLNSDSESIFAIKTVTGGQTSYSASNAQITFGGVTIGGTGGNTTVNVDPDTGEVTLVPTAAVATKVQFSSSTGEYVGVIPDRNSTNPTFKDAINFSIIGPVPVHQGDQIVNGSYSGADSTFRQAPATDTTDEGLNIFFDSLTQYSQGGTSKLSYAKGDHDVKGVGCAAGSLKGIALDQDGKIWGSYNNGLKKCLGQIAVATFANPSGLESVGNSLFAASLNSGEFDGIGEEISISGSFTVGALEMSNVDLANEFTTMITTQRGFQANSRIITTTDSMLEELVNLKR